MAAAQKFIILQFKKVRGGIAPGEMRQASSSASAEKIATAMAPRHPGVAAYSVIVDDERGDMTEPQIICQFGEIADIAA
ncbi:hypothetical protein [Pararhizobium arenae]|uniref:hypothetical protein n=1 Tax=Pararhizobium arenae TaxID=1856850 RepID=UPI00094B119B|nr:hypothetical protein [Pararhizobium arenae]